MVGVLVNSQPCAYMYIWIGSVTLWLKGEMEEGKKYNASAT